MDTAMGDTLVLGRRGLSGPASMVEDDSYLSRGASTAGHVELG
jgi:hypothetical protein